ncbi:IS3 family transposase [Bacillus thuringiensis]
MKTLQQNSPICLKTKDELIQAIETYSYHYNYKRFQKRLNHQAPIEYRISMAA